MKKEDELGEMNTENRMPSFLVSEVTPEASFDEIVQSLKAITENVHDGMIDEDVSYLQLDTIEKLAKTCKESIKESVISELQRNDGFMQRGNKIIKVIAGKAKYS